jgi:spermidine synthase
VTSEVLARADGRSGELVLRRTGADLEIVLNGAFLISTANEESSRALVRAALPHAGGRRLDVLIGGLGLGYALDEALRLPAVRSVTVAEFEPVVADWFREFGEERARRADAAERAGRLTVLLTDVADVLASSPGGYDAVCLDTDNGPDWLVREENAGLYDAGGLRRARAALRPGGVAVFWATGRSAAFEELLLASFVTIEVMPATDIVAGRPHEYSMYVARPPAEGCPGGTPGVD